MDGNDHARLGERVDELTQFFGNRCYMRMAEGHCAALVHGPEGTSLSCSVYETRPAICRELARASSECRAEIHEKGDRPVQLLVLHAKRP